jgi:hypothetical protein
VRQALEWNPPVPEKRISTMVSDGWVTQLAATHPEIRPVVVGERIVPMDTDAGVQLVPDKTFAEVPHPYVVVVPSGTEPTFEAISNAAVRRYVRTAVSLVAPLRTARPKALTRQERAAGATAS